MEEIVEQRAQKLGLTATDADVDAKLTELKAPYTEEQFRQKLQASGQTMDGLRHTLRRSLTFEKLLNKEINSTDHGDGPRCHELLQRTQGGVQPD